MIYAKYIMRKILFLLLLAPALAFATPTSLVYNVTNHQVVVGEMFSPAQSIASISKLMAVYTVLNTVQPLSEVLTVTGNPMTNTRVSKGMRLTRYDLIKLSLIGSDNLATRTLAQNYPGGEKAFVKQMNEHAQQLGMHNSRFVEPTGLSPLNNASMQDIVTLTNAVSQYEIVRYAARLPHVTVQTTKGKKTVLITRKSTSSYFGSEGVITIKTGFTRAAGFCITMLVDVNGALYNITVLGARSKAHRQELVERSLRSIRPA
jgi:D-alanyl-D-alanine endopeptidase (penicillin-binding protein 7)